MLLRNSVLETLAKLLMIRRGSRIFGSVFTTVGNAILATTFPNLTKSDHVPNNVDAEVREDEEVEVQEDVEAHVVVVGAVGSSVAEVDVCEGVLGSKVVANDPLIVAICLGVGEIVVVIVVPEVKCGLQVELILGVEAWFGQLLVALVVRSVAGGAALRILV